MNETANIKRLGSREVWSSTREKEGGAAGSAAPLVGNLPAERHPHDAILSAAITRAADQLRFDNRPGSIERQCTLGLFVAALSDRLALAFPESADALRAVVFSPATECNPVDASVEKR